MSNLCSGIDNPMPATLRIASTLPNSATAASNNAATSSSWVTSQCTGSAPSPISAAVSFSAPLMSAATAFAPSATKSFVEALAIPEPAPVITAASPSSRPITCLLLGTDCEFEVEGLEPAQHERRVVVVLVCSGRTGLGVREPDVVPPGDDPVEADPRFGARERLTRARMDAATERHVIARVRALDVELVGLLEVAGGGGW